eukprot:90772_1
MHRVIYFWFFILINIKFILSAVDYNKGWTLVSSLYSGGSTGFAGIGYDETNHSIIIFGGWPIQDYQYVISYNIDNDSFNIIPTTYSFKNVYFGGQAWTQIDNILYFVNRKTNSIDTLAMDTKQYSFLNYAIPYSTSQQNTCLCNFNNNYLIISGGMSNSFEAMNNAAIYSIKDDKWLDNFPFMQSTRFAHSCVVYGNYIYQIGGIEGGLNSDTIEKLYIDNDTINNNFTNSNWEYINYTLPSGVFSTRTVIYDNKIWIFSGPTSTQIDILDPTTDEIIKTAQTLQYSGHTAMVINVDDKIYYFGGWHKQGYPLNKWQYVNFLQTSEPITTSVLTTTSELITTSELTTTSEPRTTSEPTTTSELTTTSIERNCDCDGGMVELTVQYIGECDADITAYYDIKKRLDEILSNCVFYNVAPGEYLTCAAPVNDGQFQDKLYFDIDCAAVDYTRRLKQKQSKENKQSKEKK